MIEQNNRWETNCWICGNKIEDGFRPIIEERILYSEAGEEYRNLDHVRVTNLCLCKKCEKIVRQEIWNCFSDILKNEGNEKQIV